MMTVPLPQLQMEKHIVSVITIFLWSIWITLKPFNSWLIFFCPRWVQGWSDGHDCLVLAWLMFGVQFLTEGIVGLTAPPSSDTHTGHVYLQSQCACLWLSLSYADCISALDTSVIQSSGWAHIQDQFSSLSL